MYQALIAFIAKKIYPQLIMSCLTLPLLVLWGLPITPMVIVGNIVFVPILTIFLGLSAFVFALYWCGMSFVPLNWLLERVVGLWLYILQGFGIKQFFCFPCPYPLVALLLFACMVFILSIRVVKKGVLRLLLLVGVIILFWLCGLLCISGKEIMVGDEKTIATRIDQRGRVVLMCRKKRLCKRSIDSWISYTVKTHIARYYGRTTIDGIECDELNETICRLLLALYQQGVIVDELYITATKIKNMTDLTMLSDKLHITLASKLSV